MDLRLEDNTYVKNCKKIKSKSDFDPSKRIFYELGFYMRGGGWHPLGVFKEIMNPMDMLNKDKYLEDIDYINHHNFYKK